MKWQIASHLNVFGNFLFSKFLGNSIDEIADGRGFEPLLFHIQAELWRQRPFSEGCGGWFSETSGKKSFTKLWALDCWFSRANDQRPFCVQKGR
jgi:hypothetical protein